MTSTPDDLKAKLLAGVPGAGDLCTVETSAGTVTIRALTRAEVLQLNSFHESGRIADMAAFEQHLVSLGLVNPTITVDEVARWQETDAAGGNLMLVSDAIAKLSGIAK